MKFLEIPDYKIPSIVQVKNSIGGTTTVEYKHISDFKESIIIDEKQFPYKENRFSRYLVSKTIISGRRDVKYSTSYLYKNGMVYMDIPEKQKNLLFETFSVINDQTGEKSVTYFKQDDYRFHGKPIRQETYVGKDENQRLMKRVVYEYYGEGNSKDVFDGISTPYEYTDTDGSNKRTLNIKFKKMTTSTFKVDFNQNYTSESDSLLYTHTKEFKEYDQYGNIKLMELTTPESGLITSSFIYETDEENWIINRVVETSVVDKNNKLLKNEKYNYDNNNLESTEKNYIEEETGEETSLKTSFEYYPNGNVKKIIDAMGNYTYIIYENEYNTFPKILQTNTLDNENNEIVLETEFQYDPRYGEIEYTIDSNGNKTSYEYDSFGRLYKVIEPGDEWTKIIKYHDELQGQTGSQYVEIKYRNNFLPQKIYFDGLGREYYSVNGNIGSKKLFDDAGRLLKESNPFLIKKQYSTIFIKTYDDIYYTEYQYDEAGRIKKKISPDLKSVMEYNYSYEDGKSVVETIDPNNNSSKSYFDSLGRLVKKVDPLDGSIDYFYNSAGLLETTFLKADGKTTRTSIEYDSLGRRTSISDPNTGIWEYEYDALDRVTFERKLSRGSSDIIDEVEFVYKGNELVEEKSGDKTLTKYEYSNTEFSNSLGRVSKVTTYKHDADISTESTEESSTTFSYDIKGNISNYVTSIDKRNFGFSMGYNSQGNMTELTYPDGKTINYHYANEGHIEAITKDGKALVEYGRSYSDLSHGLHQIIRKTGNGIETIFSYDPAMMRLNRIITRNSEDIDEIFENVEYFYDPLGNIKSISTHGELIKQLQRTILNPNKPILLGHSALKSNFEYDKLSRLKSAKGIYDKINYEYKGNGNLCQKGELEFYYKNTDLPNAVSGDSSGNKYEYDGKGNLTSYKGKELSYDIKGQLKSINFVGKSEEFVYDYAGKRLKTVKNDGTIIYSIGGIYELIVTSGSDGKEIPGKYVFGYNGDPVAKLIGADPDGAVINPYLFSFRMHNWRSLKGFMLKLYAGANYLAFNKDCYRFFMIFTAITFALFVFILWLKVVITSDFVSFGFKKWAFHLTPVILITFFGVFGYTGCFLTNFEGYSTKGVKYYHPDHVGSIKMISDSEGNIVAFNNYTPYGDDASKYKGFDENVVDLKEILRTSSAKLKQLESRMKEMAKEHSFLSMNNLDNKAESFWQKLSGIDVRFSSSSKDVNLAGFDFDIGFNLDEIKNFDRIHEELLNKFPRDKINSSNPDFIELQKFIEEMEDKFSEFQQDYSKLKRQVTLLETMVGEKDTSDITRIKYTSQEHDKDTGLYYYGARYYDPEIGRFIQPDSYIDGVASTQGWNRYMYVHGNPVNNSDPTGNFFLFLPFFGGGSGGSSGGSSGWTFSFSGMISSFVNMFSGTMSKSGYRPTYTYSSAPVSMPPQFNSMPQITNWSAGANGPAITSNYSNTMTSYFGGITQSIVDDIIMGTKSLISMPFVVAENTVSMVNSLLHPIDTYDNISKFISEDPARFAGMMTYRTVQGVLSGAAIKGGLFDALGNGGRTISNPIINSERIGSALKLDKFHNFNKIIDNYAGSAKRFKIPTRGPGGQVTRMSELFQIKGSLNGRGGIFEWILDTGKVTHRRFIPGGRITGFPNQIP
jgi:RHS repeat-associated protein